MRNIYPRETSEFAPVTVTLDRVPTTTGVKFAVVSSGTRPSVWINPVTNNGLIGVMISGMSTGTYEVYAQVTNAPDVSVIDCGYFTIV